MGVIEQAIDNLDNLEEDFAPVLMQLGRKHPIKADFSPDKVEVFVKSVLVIWREFLKDKLTLECRAAWEKLFQYFLEKLRQGYRYNLKQNKLLK